MRLAAKEAAGFPEGPALRARVVLSHVAHSSAEVAPLPTLTPPFFAFRSELAATVGKTPGVKVGPLVEGSDGNDSVRVVASTHA